MNVMESLSEEVTEFIEKIDNLNEFSSPDIIAETLKSQAPEGLNLPVSSKVDLTRSAPEGFNFPISSRDDLNRLDASIAASSEEKLNFVSTSNF